MKHLVKAPNGDTLTIAEKLILSLLADDHNEDERAAWPSVPKLALRACMSEKHCRRLLRQLEEKGVVESTPMLRENGGRSTSRYRFPQIDPAFDKKKVAETSKLLQLQAARASARPVQMKLGNVVEKQGTPPPSQGRGPLPRKGGAPGHRREGAPDTGGRGPLTPEGGGKEPLTEPLGQPPVELPLDPKASPTPRQRGVKSSPVEIAAQGEGLADADDSGFTLLKARLKIGLRDVPVGLAKRFGEIRTGVDDYDACFREWWLVRREDAADRVVLVTQSGDPDATQAGIAKYKARLVSEARGTFANTRGRTFEFQVEPAARGVEIAASADPPKT